MLSPPQRRGEQAGCWVPAHSGALHPLSFSPHLCPCSHQRTFVLEVMGRHCG